MAHGGYRPKKPGALYGRRSIFRGKTKAAKNSRGAVPAALRVQAELTAIGAQWFYVAKRKLAKLAGRDGEEIGNSDTIEYLARGAENTGRYLDGEDIPPRGK